jgi:hypothetical protein
VSIRVLPILKQSKLIIVAVRLGYDKISLEMAIYQNLYCYISRI